MNTQTSGSGETVYMDFGLEYWLNQLPMTVKVKDYYRMWCDKEKEQDAYLNIKKVKDGWYVFYESAFRQWGSRANDLIQAVYKVVEWVQERKAGK